MEDKSAELAREQAYFDLALKHRERRRDGLGDEPSAAANPNAARRLLSWMKGRKDGAGPPDAAVAFGRIDDESANTLYIGRELITDEDHEVLVIMWKAPAASRYYEASHADPHGLVRKRTFRCTGNVIDDLDEVVFRQLADDVAALEGPDALLLSELDSARTGVMRDIVATIRAAQHELIRAPIDQVLVIEGGPGTGKTAVALHRLSWLLFNHRDRLSPADILVVGPHPAFTRYIRTVLPDLGDNDVDQQDIGQLAPTVHRGRRESSDVHRLKGVARMAGLLARALEAHIGTPEPAERLQLHGRFITLSGVEVASALAACRASSGPYADRRDLLRVRLLDLAHDRGAPADRGGFEALDNLVERLWPRVSAPAFLHGLLGSKPRLRSAAGEAFTAEEVALLHRRGADRLTQEIWSAADLPLLDEAQALIKPATRSYRHIVLDEAQDLSPMQLRSVARRSATGSLTVVGDLTQSTGPWARDDWDDVLRYLPDTLPRSVVGLRYGYRVPRQVYELAARLLSAAAPDARPVQVVRDGPADPGIHCVEASERAGRAVTVAMAHAAAGRFVGVICPPAHRGELEEALAANRATWSSADRGELDSPINLVSPEEAKGLEFDAVVVVEPEEIVAGDEQGHRMLFVAFTRTTRYLDVVCAGDPVPLSVPAPSAVTRPSDLDPAVDPAQLDRLAQEVAAMVSGGAPPPAWHEVLERAAGILMERSGRTEPSGRHRRD